MHITEVPWSNILSSLAEGIVVQDMSGRILTCNSSAERILGLTTAPMGGATDMNPAWRTIHEDGSPFPVETHPAMVALRTGQSVTGAIMGICTPDGPLRWASLSSHPILRDGKPQAVFTIVADVTEQKAAEHALRVEEERWKTMVNSARDGIWEWNAPTDGVFFSRRWKEILGYEDSEIANSHSEWEERVHPEDRLSTYAALNDHLHGKSPFYEAEYRLKCKDGTWKWVRARGTVVSRGTDGKPLRFVGAHTDITEHKRAEQALQESEVRFRTLIEDAPIAIGISRDGRVLYANSAYLRMFGFERLDEIVGDSIADHWSPECRALIDEHASLRSPGEPARTEYQAIAIRKEGSQFPAQVLVTMVDFPDGQATVVFVSDLTERKRAEEALQQRNRYIETVLEKAPIGFAVHTMDDGVGRFVSARFEEIYGVARGTIDSHYTFFEKVWRYDPDFREQIRARVMADTTSGDASRMHWENVPVRTATGGTRYITAVNIPLPEQNLMVSTVRDVTAQVRAQEALRESEERFRQVAETVSDFVWDVDAHGLYTYTSPSVEKILGYSPDEIVGKLHFYDLFAPDPREALRAAVFERFAARQRFQAFPTSNVHKNGTTIQLETSGVPIVHPSGTLRGYRGASTDVTERYRAEAEARVLREELALFSRVATVGELTASIAHELNQPLTAILYNSQAALRLIQSGAPDLKEIRDILEDISADNQRAAEVIRSLRSLLKRGSGDHHPLVLNDLITDVLSIVRSDAAARKISIILDLRSPMPAITGDRVQLQQVILNLIVNAFEAMEQADGVRELKLGTRQVENEVILDVTDSGSGIPPGKIKTIFEPFFTTKTTGLGMGLPLSRSIVTAHNGRLWAESNSERGATFHVALPFRPQFT